MYFDEEFGHALEIPDCFLDVFHAFDEEVVDCLGGRYCSLYGFDKFWTVESSIILNNINNMSHSRFHQPKLQSSDSPHLHQRVLRTFCSWNRPPVIL